VLLFIVRQLFLIRCLFFVLSAVVALAVVVGVLSEPPTTEKFFPTLKIGVWCALTTDFQN